MPFDRRDQLAVLLTDDDVATLNHLAGEGMGDNTLKALAADLGYLEAWCQLATGSPLPWPAAQSLLRPSSAGPRQARGRSEPLHASGRTHWRGLTGAIDGPSLKSALGLAIRASARPRQRKSKKGGDRRYPGKAAGRLRR
ncbi:hypothetical protein IB277_34820 [Ensifer sp. ENS07]|nr:hypothetical protein [Ensifer sp. ENS07]